MHIIEAYKQTKKGYSLKRKHQVFGGIVKGDSFWQDIRRYNDDEILADDWEVVREKKVLNLEWGDMSNSLDEKYVYNNTQSLTQNHDIPKDAKVTIEWEA